LALLQGGAGAAQAAPAKAAPAKSAPAPAVAPAPAAKEDGVVASIANRPITMDQLMKPLVEAHGLTVLMNLVQLELAKDLAQQQGVKVTDEDVAQERKQTLDRLFADGDQKTQDRIDNAVRKNQPEEADRLRKEMERDHEQLFEQFLQNQKVTKPEFELVLKTNTYLRKLVEPKIDAAITDKELRQSFEVEYGASVRVRHIQANNAAELGQALTRIKNGEPFEKVARDVSRNPTTAPLGGELPRFSLATAGLPENFKLAAFALQVGEISNPVEAEGAFHIIKLEEKFAPKAVKFENVKESVRQNLKDRMIQAAVKQYRNKLAERARKELKITEPTLASQFAERLADRDKQILDQREVRRQMEKERDRDAQQNGTAPPADSTTPPPATTDLPTPPAGQGPAVAPPPAAPAPAPRAIGAAALPKKDEGPIKPGIVVPIPSRAAPGAASAQPARATEPAQGTQAAPAGK
jgi:parvulin-like peptidyl-prolyl isomerase